MTTAEVYNQFKNQLKTIYDNREADTISDWVFENVTGLKRWERREDQHKQLNKTDSQKLKKYLQELLKHKPVQYILNEAWFYKMKFYVNEHVLIPRPETEELVEWILSSKKNNAAFNSKRTNIIDIGTGSGCIPISIKKELPAANITGIDVSEKAIEVAKKNAARLNTSIDFFQIDFLKEDQWKILLQYDIIVSNPPYIPISEKQILAKNVADFEPKIALFVEDNDPFIFYKKIVQFAENHLKENGEIYAEVHEQFAKKVKGIFDDAGFITTVKKDIYGKERMVKGCRL